MLRQSLRRFLLAALAAVAFASPAVAGVTPIDACGVLDKAGETYVLTRDLGPESILPLGCFFVVANRITLDLNGHTVTGAGGEGFGIVTDGDLGATSTVVKNGTFKNVGIAIAMRLAPRTTVRAVTVLNASVIAIFVGPGSLVKDCILQRGGGHGVVARDGSQVEGCVIGGTQEGDGNSVRGIEGGNRVLVTRNTVIGNGSNGIHVGSNSTVTHNTVSDNGGDGINVGAGSLVTSNTSSGNGGDGIEAVCKSTITHNTALGNDGENFNPVGQGCVVLHNDFTDPE